MADLSSPTSINLTLPPVYDPTIINRVFNSTAPHIEGPNIAGNIMSGISSGISLGKSLYGLKGAGAADDASAKQSQVQSAVADRQLSAMDSSNASSPYNNPATKDYLTQVPGMSQPQTPTAAQQAYNAQLRQTMIDQANVNKTQAETDKIRNPDSNDTFSKLTGTANSVPASPPITLPAPAAAPGVVTSAPTSQSQPAQPAPTGTGSVVPVAATKGSVAASKAPAQVAQPDVRQSLLDTTQDPDPEDPGAQQPKPSQPVDNTVSLMARGNVLPFNNDDVLKWYKANVSTSATGVAQNTDLGVYNVAFKKPDGSMGNQPVHPGYIAQNPGHTNLSFTNQAMTRDPMAGVTAPDPHMGDSGPSSGSVSQDSDLVPRAELVAKPTPLTTAQVASATANQATGGTGLPPAPATPPPPPVATAQTPANALKTPDGSVPATTIQPTSSKVQEPDPAAKNVPGAVGDIALGNAPKTSPFDGISTGPLAPADQQPTGAKPNGGTHDQQFVAANGTKYYIDSGNNRPYVVQGETPYSEERIYKGSNTPVSYPKADADSIKEQNTMLVKAGKTPSDLSPADRVAALRLIVAKQDEKEKKPLPPNDELRFEVTQDLIKNGQRLQGLYKNLSPDELSELQTGVNQIKDNYGGLAKGIVKLATGDRMKLPDSVTSVSPKVREVQQAYTEMQNVMAKMRSGNVLNKDEITRLGAEMGQPSQQSFGQSLDRFVQARTEEFPRIVDYANANKFSFNPDYAKFANTLHPVGQTASQQAPAGTPSVQNAVSKVSSRADYDALPSGTRYQDSQGVKIKP